MEMKIDKCANMLIAKEKCMDRETSGRDTDCNFHNCDDCSLCYEQGTMGEQKEALKFAVDTMRKYKELLDYIGGMNMCDEISNEAYKKIMIKFSE